jgi:hypothetical protein
MKHLSLGGACFRLQATTRGNAWVASAEQIENGARFGIECTGASEREALERLAAWMTWQHEHAAALSALQEAEGDYHRAIAGSAFAESAAVAAQNAVVDRGGGPGLHKAGLSAVAAARVRLDEIRARRPE